MRILPAALKGIAVIVVLGSLALVSTSSHTLTTPARAFMSAQSLLIVPPGYYANRVLFGKAKPQKDPDVFTRVLASGSISMQVKLLQALLTDLGYIEDLEDRPAYFGTMTKEALEAFQEDHDLVVTGFTDDNTRALLNALYWKGRHALETASTVPSDEAP